MDKIHCANKSSLATFQVVSDALTRPSVCSVCQLRPIQKGVYAATVSTTHLYVLGNNLTSRGLGPISIAIGGKITRSQASDDLHPFEASDLVKVSFLSALPRTLRPRHAFSAFLRHGCSEVLFVELIETTWRILLLRYFRIMSMSFCKFASSETRTMHSENECPRQCDASSGQTCGSFGPLLIGRLSQCRQSGTV